MKIGRASFTRQSLVSKLTLTVGLTLLLSISVWSYFNIKYQKEKMMRNILVETDRLTSTIKLGAHYAMMLNSRDDINQIINNIARLEQIETIRIYNKEGQIKFSNRPDDVDRTTDIEAEACNVCHRSQPPLLDLKLDEKSRISRSGDGYRVLGIISPIKNEPACASAACHVHPEDKSILGALDVVVSLGNTDREILKAEHGLIFLAGFLFLATSAIIFVFLQQFVNRPIQRLIAGTRRIAGGEYGTRVVVNQVDEMGQLADAINQMGTKIGASHEELTRQRDEYQQLFDIVPCMITVQDRSYRLLNFNRLFAETFAPTLGDLCYRAYKGLEEKCPHCPVEKTFATGRSHYSEETGVNRDGSLTHWFVITSPVRNGAGEIEATMEVSLDITRRKRLEEELERSEKQYHLIFNNIPNPVFVVDPDSYEVLDCNPSVHAVYGFEPQDLIGVSFLELFAAEERERYASLMSQVNLINQATHRHRGGGTIYVNIRISPSEYQERPVLLVTIGDITKRLEAEQQLIQASKMATLGEMATGVAHELNQPLSVIKTASSFFVRKLGRGETIDAPVLTNMLTKVDNNVDRAAKIINHMRQFARKSELTLEKTSIRQVLESAYDIFSQQLKVRGIEVHWSLDPDLPAIMADPARLEQVFINLLVNARDAIEERWAGKPADPGTPAAEKSIFIRTGVEGEPAAVVVELEDTGAGIPAPIRDKIFEPFFTTKEFGKGTGLGLSISYGIVKDCRGEIRASNGKHGGARFTLRFPLQGDSDERQDTAG